MGAGSSISAPELCLLENVELVAIAPDGDPCARGRLRSDMCAEAVEVLRETSGKVRSANEKLRDLPSPKDEFEPAVRVVQKGLEDDFTPAECQRMERCEPDSDSVTSLQEATPAKKLSSASTSSTATSSSFNSITHFRLDHGGGARMKSTSTDSPQSKPSQAPRAGNRSVSQRSQRSASQAGQAPRSLHKSRSMTSTSGVMLEDPTTPTPKLTNGNISTSSAIPSSVPKPLATMDPTCRWNLRIDPYDLGLTIESSAERGVFLFSDGKDEEGPRCGVADRKNPHPAIDWGRWEYVGRKGEGDGKGDSDSSSTQRRRRYRKAAAAKKPNSITSLAQKLLSTRKKCIRYSNARQRMRIKLPETAETHLLESNNIPQTATNKSLKTSLKTSLLDCITSIVHDGQSLDPESPSYNRSFDYEEWKERDKRRWQWRLVFVDDMMGGAKSAGSRNISSIAGHSPLRSRSGSPLKKSASGNLRKSSSGSRNLGSGCGSSYGIHPSTRHNLRSHYAHRYGTEDKGGHYVFAGRNQKTVTQTHRHGSTSYRRSKSDADIHFSYRAYGSNVAKDSSDVKKDDNKSSGEIKNSTSHASLMPSEEDVEESDTVDYNVNDVHAGLVDPDGDNGQLPRSGAGPGPVGTFLFVKEGSHSRVAEGCITESVTDSSPHPPLDQNPPPLDQNQHSPLTQPPPSLSLHHILSIPAPDNLNESGTKTYSKNIPSNNRALVKYSLRSGSRVYLQSRNPNPRQFGKYLGLGIVKNTGIGKSRCSASGEADGGDTGTGTAVYVHKWFSEPCLECEWMLKWKG